MFAPGRSPTATWMPMARSSSRRPQPDSGSACSQSLLWGDVTDSSRALYVALLTLLITVCLSRVIIIIISSSSSSSGSSRTVEKHVSPHLPQWIH